MFQRPRTGSVVCPTCGRLVGVRDAACLGCGRTHPGMWGFAPLLGRLGRSISFTDLVLWSCGAIYVLTLVYDLSAIRGGGLLNLLAPGGEAIWVFGASGAKPVFYFGRWWTVLSAAWLHGGVLHIVMNMMWMRQLLPAVDRFYGTGRLMIIYTVSAIVGFGLTSIMGLFVFLPDFLRGAGLTVGASAPLFGLFGALVVYGQRTGANLLSRQVWQWVIVFGVIGILIPLVDNWAHMGGFLGGYLAARVLDPQRSETPQHLIIGLGCLGLSALSIIVSVIHGLGQIRLLGQ